MSCYKPHSITLAGSELVRSWFEAGRRPASSTHTHTHAHTHTHTHC